MSAETQELIEVLAHKYESAMIAAVKAGDCCLPGSSFDSPVVMSFDVLVNCVIVDVEHDGVSRELMQFYTKSGKFLAERLCLL